MNRLLCVFVCFFCTASIPGAQHIQILRETASWKPAQKINAFLFTSAQFQLLVLDEGSVSSPRYGSLGEAMRAHGCIAGVNAGFFSADSAGSPLGLCISNGVRISNLASSSFAVAGVLYDTGKEIILERTKTYMQRKSPINMKNAIQGGPFLVENGRPVAGLHDDRKALRTFVATDGRGHWCLGSSSPLSLKELAQWLCEPNCTGRFQIQTALNLDGGSSSAYWVQTPHRNYPSIKQVRNYIGLIPRTGQITLPASEKSAR